MTQNSRPEHHWSSMEAGSRNEQKLDQLNFMKIPFTGGCACGAIRYESTTEPMEMFHCHCRDCQQSSGGPFSSFVIVPAEAFKLLQGSLRFHASPSTRGGKTNRGFCLECGSPILAKADSNPHI